MERLKKDDKVTHFSHPGETGTVAEIEDPGPLGLRTYHVSWPAHPDLLIPYVDHLRSAEGD